MPSPSWGWGSSSLKPPPSKDVQGKHFPHPIPGSCQAPSLQGSGAELAGASGGLGGAQHTWLGQARTHPLVRNVDAARAGLGKLPPPGSRPALTQPGWAGKLQPQQDQSLRPTLPIGTQGLKPVTGCERGATGWVSAHRASGLGGTAGTLLDLPFSCTARGLPTAVSPKCQDSGCSKHSGLSHRT